MNTTNHTNDNLLSETDYSERSWELCAKLSFNPASLAVINFT